MSATVVALSIQLRSVVEAFCKLSRNLSLLFGDGKGNQIPLVVVMQLVVVG